MRASEVAGAASFAVLIGVALLSGVVEDRGTQRVLYGIGLASIVWYVWKGHNLKGWLGDSYAEMEREIAHLDSLSHSWRYPNGSEVPAEKHREILRRRQRLIDKIQFHPDNPRRY